MTRAVARRDSRVGRCVRACSTPRGRPRHEPTDDVDGGRQLYITGCSSVPRHRRPRHRQGPSRRARGAAGARLLPHHRPHAARRTRRRKPCASRPRTHPSRSTSWSPTWRRSARARRSPTSTSPTATSATATTALPDNCAACHSAAGVGRRARLRRQAPSLRRATPTAGGRGRPHRPGPDAGVRPRDARRPAGLDRSSRYVEYLQDPERPGRPRARATSGPIPEGFVAWVVGLGRCSCSLGIIGSIAQTRDADVNAPGAPSGWWPMCFGAHGARVARASLPRLLRGRPAAGRRRAARARASADRRRHRLLGRHAPAARGGHEEPRRELESPRRNEEAVEAVFDVEPPRRGRTLGRRTLPGALLVRRRRRARPRALFPIRSLGPEPGADSAGARTWRRRRVVDEDGEPVELDDLPSAACSPCSPKATTDAEDSPTLLIRRRPTTTSSRRRAARTWAPDGLRRLLEDLHPRRLPGRPLPGGVDELLLCPCHQSTFDVLDGATPVFGPATRSLPQLPLAVDDDGVPRRRRATSPSPSAPASGTVTATVTCRCGARLARLPGGSTTGSAAPSFARTALDKVFPDHWSFMLGEIALYCFVILLADRHVPHVLLRRRPSEVVYDGQLRPAAGRRDVGRRTSRPSTSASTCGPAW